MPCKPPPPPPFTVTVDTREQLPWALAISERGKRLEIPTVRGTLTEGDYQLVGHRVAIERKSLADAVGTAFGSTVLADGSKGLAWDRFRRELERVREAKMDRFWIFIEASRGDVFGHRYHSGVDPKSVLGRWDSIVVDHGIPVLWCGSREEAQRMAAWFFKRWVEGFERASKSTG